MIRFLKEYFNLFSLTILDEYEVLKLLFFGNLYQDLHVFILEDLTILKYEQYVIEDRLLLFNNRVVVDDYVKLSYLSQLLWEAKELKDSNLLDIVWGNISSENDFSKELLSKYKMILLLLYEARRLGFLVLFVC